MGISQMPDANFSPEMAEYSGQGQFRFWCQKVLPIVYDDSLSYYELLCKVVDSLNKVISDENTLQSNMQALLDAYNRLQDYVNNYFDTLDVQAEINNKLDEMIESGEFDDIILPTVANVTGNKVEELLPTVVEGQIGDVVEEQIGGVVEQQLPGVVNPQIPDAVGDWLDENVDPSTVPVVDTSLIIASAAADSRMTGIARKGLYEKIKREYPNTVLTFEVGSLGYSTGAEVENTHHGRSDYIKGAYAIFGNDFLQIRGKISVFGYYENGDNTYTYIGWYDGVRFYNTGTSVYRSADAFIGLPKTYNIDGIVGVKEVVYRFCIILSDDYAFNPTTEYVTVHFGPDTTLGASGAVPDSKTVGDAIDEINESITNVSESVDELSDSVDGLSESVNDFNDWLNEIEPSIMRYNSKENDIDIATYVTEELCLLDSPTFEFGDIDTTDGSSVGGNYRIITSNYFTKNDYFAVFIPNEYRQTYGIEIVAYDANDNYIGIYTGPSGFSHSENVNFIKSLLIKENYKFKVVVNRYGSTPIAIVDGENIKFATSISSGGSGGDVTPASVVTATGNMTAEQKTQTRENIGAGEPLTSQQIADAAGAWLSANLVTPSTPPIDTSLSVASAGADANATGVVVKNSTEDEFDLRNVEFVHKQLATNGEVGTVTRNYLASKPNFFTLPFDTIMYMPSGYHIKYYKFDENGTLVYTSSINNTIDERVYLEGNKKYRFQISNQAVGTTGTIDLDEVKKSAKCFSKNKMNMCSDYVWEKFYPGFISVNHRGYNTVAPENTLPAYRLSKSKGFAFGETDVQWTSDGVPVLLHDASINRTARNADGTSISGTVNIASITYEQALTYDFGVWMGSEYQGTKIPTFNEFITLCKNIGLCAIVQIGIQNTTDAQISGLVSSVKSLGMEKCVIWLCNTALQVRQIITLDENACAGLYGYSVTESSMDYLAASLTGKNKLFFDFAYGQGGGAYNWNSETAMNICEKRKIVIGVYDANNDTSIKSLSPRVKVVTSDVAVPSEVMYDANIGDPDTGLIA